MYHTDWKRIRRRVNSEAKKAWDAVFVTANSVFGQSAVDYTDITNLIELNTRIRRNHPQTRLFVLGTHPSFSQARVTSTWKRIREELGATSEFSGDITYESWNPIGNAPDIENSWKRWMGHNSQKADILELPPRGGR